jgi:hypothetical protein
MVDLTDKETAVAFLKKAGIDTRQPIEIIKGPLEIDRYYQSLDAQTGTWIESNASLHCWAEIYRCDGKEYQFTGIVGEGWPYNLVIYQLES